MSQKSVQRTIDLQNQIRRHVVNDIAVNNIEQHNFNKLVRTGVIVAERQ